MRRALLALCLVACGGAQRSAPHDPIALSYDVTIDAALSTMRVTLCPADEPLPAAIVAVHDEGAERVRAPVLVRDGAVVQALALDRRIDLTGAPAGTCVRYDVDLSACGMPHGPNGCARIGRDLFAPTSVWMLAPERRMLAAHYDLRFVLPEGVFVSPISELGSSDPTRVVMDERNFAFVTYLAFSHAPARSIAVPGGCLDVVTLDGPLDASFDARAHWLSVAAEASSRVSGQAPFERMTALIVPTPDVPGTPVLFGVAGRGMRPTVTLLVSEHATEAQLVPDWTAVHELSHLLTSYLGGEDTWLSEGLATYYEEVLRAREGQRTETEAWTSLVHGFGRGRADTTGGTLREACTSMHASRAYGRVYWEGAALVLMADVAYRRRGSSLDEAIARLWSHRTERTNAGQLVVWLDGAIGGEIVGMDDGPFARIVAASLDAEGFPDVDTTLAWLGVVTLPDGTVSLDANAPGSVVRTAIMNGTAGPASNPASCDAFGR